MNKKGILVVLLGLWYGWTVYGQTAPLLTDLIYLKNGSVLKGKLTKMTIGKTVFFEADSGVYRLPQADLLSSFQVDAGAQTIQTFPLKNGQTIKGRLLGMAPGKWYEISVSELSPATYPLDSVLKLGKEPNVTPEQFFRHGGLADVLVLGNGSKQSGIITGQHFDGRFELLTPEGVYLFFDRTDIRKLEKKALDPKTDLFVQAPALDSVALREGGWIRGVILEQIPGKTVRIATKDMERLVGYEEIVSLSRVANPDWIDWRAPRPRKVKEPRYIGDCAWVPQADRPDSLIAIEKQPFKAVRRDADIYKLTGNPSINAFAAGKETVFRVRVINNRLEPSGQIYIFPVTLSKDGRLVDDSRSQVVNQVGAPFDTAVFIPYRVKKCGESSFDITFSIDTPGEYAVYVNGCNQTFSVFRIE